MRQFLTGLSEKRIRHVYAGLFDQEGTWRGKKLPLSQFSEFALKGWSFIDALPWWGPNDTVRVDKAFRSEACSFDRESLRKYPFEADSVIVAADYEGPSKKFSPRVMLQKQILVSFSVAQTSVMLTVKSPQDSIMLATLSFVRRLSTKMVLRLGLLSISWLRSRVAKSTTLSSK